MTSDELAQASCRGRDTALWFPFGENSTRSHLRSIHAWRAAASQAIAICDQCPVVDACRVEAVRTHDWHGVRAGLTPPELQRLAIRREVA